MKNLKKTASNNQIASSQLDRIKTTIPGFDEMVMGGLFRGEVYSLMGLPGAGKTIFGLQFLYGGIRLGENGICVSLDEPIESLLKTGKFFGWDFERFISDKKVAFLDVSPYRGFQEEEYFIQEEDSVLGMPVFNLDTLIKRISKTVEKVNAQRVFIDCVSMIEYQIKDPFSLRADLLSLKRTLKSLDVTAILSFEAKSVQSLEEFGFESYFPEGVIMLSRLLNEKDRANRRTRFIEVFKMRHSAHDEQKRPFKITDQGIVVYSKEELFI